MRTGGRKAVVVVLLALLASACGGSEDDNAADDSTPVVDQAAPLSQEEEARQTGDLIEPPAGVSTETQALETSGRFDDEVKRLSFDGETFAAGRYQTSSLGTPVQVTTDREWFALVNEVGLVALARFDGPEMMVFSRMTSFGDPLQPIGKVPDADAGDRLSDAIPDITDWIDRLTTAEVTTAMSDQQVGGHAAVRFDLQLVDNPACQGVIMEDAFCFLFGRTFHGRVVWFTGTRKYRVWWVDQGGEAPVQIIAVAGIEDGTFFSEAQVLVDTISFGDVRPPHQSAVFAPVITGEGPTLIGPGAVTLRAGGGVEVVLEAETPYRQNGELGVFLNQGGVGDVEIFRPTSVSGGSEIDSAADITEALQSADGFEVVELDGVEVAGFSTRVFDLTNGPTSVHDPRFGPLFDYSGATVGWVRPSAGVSGSSIANLVQSSSPLKSSTTTSTRCPSRSRLQNNSWRR